MGGRRPTDRAWVSADGGWIRRLAPYVLRQRAGLVRTFVAGLVGAAVGTAVPVVERRIVDDVILTHRASAVPLLLLLAGLGVAGFVAARIRRFNASRVVLEVSYGLRAAIHACLQRLDLVAHGGLATGQLVSRANADISLVLRVLRVLPMMASNLVLMAGALVVMFVFSPPLALISLVMVPALAVGAYRMRSRLYPATWDVQQRTGEVAQVVDQAVTGVRVVKAFGQEGREFARLADAAAALYGSSVRALRIQARYQPALEAIPSFGQAGVLALGGWLALRHQITVGTFLAFASYLVMLVGPARMLAGMFASGQQARAGAERIFALLDAAPAVTDAPGARVLPPVTGEIRFERVRFAFPGSPPVLNGFDLRIAPGETVALVGASASGKSTAALLLGRFYDVTGGAVRVDGHDVRDVTLASLRSQLGMVFEESFLFSESIRDNIAYGRPDATDEEVEAAARAAEAHEFVTRLPDGYATVVGERGLTLSGGQRQRVALARALLADPRILILDDATSAVDAKVEESIHAALRRVLRAPGRPRTALLVAHRRSTLRLADRIAVVDGGRVVDDGTHAELMARCPLYRRLLAGEGDRIDGGDPAAAGTTGPLARTRMGDIGIADSRFVAAGAAGTVGMPAGTGGHADGRRPATDGRRPDAVPDAGLDSGRPAAGAAAGDGAPGNGAPGKGARGPWGDAAPRGGRPVAGDGDPGDGHAGGAAPGEAGVPENVAVSIETAQARAAEVAAAGVRGAVAAGAEAARAGMAGAEAARTEGAVGRPSGGRFGDLGQEDLRRRVAALPPVRDVPDVDVSRESRPAPGFRLWRFLRPYRRPLALGLVLVVLDALAGVAGPYISRDGIDHGVLTGSRAALFTAAGVFLGVALAGLVVGRAVTLVAGRTGERLMYALRIRVWAQLQRLSVDYYDREMAGVIMTRMTTDVGAFSSVLQDGLINALASLFTFAGVAVAMVVMSPPLTGAAAIVLVPLVAATVLFRRLSATPYRESRERLARVNAGLQESIAGVRESQAFTQERRRHALFTRLTRDYVASRLAAQQLVSLYFPFVDLLSSLAAVLVLAVGQHLAAEGALTPGALIAFLLYLNLFFAPIQQLSEVFDDWQQARVSMARIAELMDVPVATPVAAHPVDPGRLRGEIRLEGVRFGYRGGAGDALAGVDLEIAPGETVALVGATGAGKSSLVKLLARFHDPDAGRVLVDGHDLRDLDPVAYRRQLGYVPQEAFLFRGTVRDNIAYGRPDASAEQIEAAARSVGAHELIMRLPGGYDHEIAERGASLSAGQRQLLCLARAALVDPAILLLDEATANLDLATEARITRAMGSVASGRTTVVIAHRLQTARTADRIIVLDRGRVVEDGTHEELLRDRGAYALLWQAA